MNQTPLDEFAAEAKRLCALGSLPTAAATVHASYHPARPGLSAFSTYMILVSDTAFCSPAQPLGLPLFSTLTTHPTTGDALAELASLMGIAYSNGPVEWATADQREVLCGMAASPYLTRPERTRILLNVNRLTKEQATESIRTHAALIRSALPLSGTIR